MSPLVKELQRRAVAASERGDFELFDLLDITARRLDFVETRLAGELVNAERLASALDDPMVESPGRALRLHHERRSINR